MVAWASCSLLLHLTTLFNPCLDVRIQECQGEGWEWLNWYVNKRRGTPKSCHQGEWHFPECLYQLCFWLPGNGEGINLNLYRHSGSFLLTALFFLAVPVLDIGVNVLLAYKLAALHPAFFKKSYKSCYLMKVYKKMAYQTFYSVAFHQRFQWCLPPQGIVFS